jgi:hypothetical protein
MNNDRADDDARDCVTAIAENESFDEKIERELDDALKDTFPASDPITLSVERVKSSYAELLARKFRQ